MAEQIQLKPTCELFDEILHCSIESDATNCEYAFYININGDRRMTRWYSKIDSVTYSLKDETVHNYDVTFFVREENGNINHKTISRNTRWAICAGIAFAVSILADNSSNLVEFGSGYGSQELSKYLSVYSVEHDDRYISMFPNVNYIHAPLTNYSFTNGDTEISWYDAEIVREKIPKDYDIILVDGPPKKIGRLGLLLHLDLFKDDVIWIIDDVLRGEEQEIANHICLHFSMIQYRFWNFSILSRESISEELIQKIHEVSLKVIKDESTTYLSTFYKYLIRK